MSSAVTQIIKQAAIEAVEASKPCEWVVGTVISTSPLKVKIDQKLTLSQTFIVIGQRMKDTVFKLNDKVILLKQRGGQKFLLLDIL